MSYLTALEKAGAIILKYESFGSYQGDWFAVVSHEGQDKLVGGSYGSCSGCDAYESEFAYFFDELEESELDKKLSAFGLQYLDALNIDDRINHFKEQAKWDDDAEEIVEVLTSWKKEYNL